jgi:acyl-CoA synthetase (AMP-forming)/AMP-acid ligase II
MIEPDDHLTIGAAFERAAARFGGRPFLAVPANERRDYHPAGFEITYAAAAAEVRRLAEAYREARYGAGHRVALLLDNRPEHYLHKLALNTLGACCVPINPDYRASEIAYLLDHSKPDLVVALAARQEQVAQGFAAAARRAPMIAFEQFDTGVPSPAARASANAIGPETPASILYTSGTTGRPKGCVLSHGYELASGAWYARLGGLAAVRARDRLYNPLPVYHCNAAVFSLFCMLLTGNCQIQADRFQPQRWWPEVTQTEATIVHYLGVIVPLLLGLPPGDDERRHRVRFGIGAGVEPQLHARFEERFGFPLIEVWGMTEMVRVIADNVPPRKVGTRAFGRAVPTVEVRVVDEADREVPDGQPGELTIRYSEATPRRHFFSGYLDDEAATEHAWRGGWFHTGDTVRREPDGMLHFVDRKKNIIRRSGENIAAAEVEALLQAHDLVKQVAVIAVPDELREEEVFAAIVLASGTPVRATAESLFRHCYERLAYYKAPGWILFTDGLPTTGTQKIQKHRLFEPGTDARKLAGVFDLRALKRRA